MSPSSAAASQLRQLIFYHIDNDLLENANFLAGRLHALEPRNPDASHLLALTYLRLRRYKAAYDFSQKYGANGRHLGCAYVLAQASLQLGRGADGISALEKAKAAWVGKSHWNKHSETTRRHLPDAAAAYTLLAKLWQMQGDSKKAGDFYIEAHKANPFIWDAFDGLCKVGADMNVTNMFRPTQDMVRPDAGTFPSSDVYQDDVAANSFNQQVFTPSADPFTSSRGDSHSFFSGLKGKSALLHSSKQPLSQWDSPTANGGVLDEDIAMGGVLVDEAELVPQPPPAPTRRARPGQTLEASDRPRQPALRGHAPSGLEVAHDPDTSLAHRRPTSGLGAHKRTISGQPTSQASSSSISGSISNPRRSNRLFGQATASTRTTRPVADSSASIAGRVDGAVRPSKPATGTRGRIGSTVGRVVSGNRKMLPPDRGEKEKDKRAPSRNGDKPVPASSAPLVTSTMIQPPVKAELPLNDSLEQSKAINALLDSFRDLAVGCYATSRFQLPEAIRAFRSLPPAQRETPWVLAQFGKAHYEAGDYTSAEECFARAMKLQPSRIEDAEVYSSVLWHLKKESALAFLSHTLRDQDFHAPQTWVTIGNAFSLSREHDQAIAAFKRATQIDETFAYAWILMGHEYIANEEYDAALFSFRKSVAVDRRGYGGWYGLAKTHERMGKLEEAERSYRIAATINPSNATLLVCIGMVLERLRNKPAALANYSKALELNPNSALARFKKARVLMHLRHYPEALAELEILRDQAPDEANVWFLLGKCYKGLGDRSDALRALTTALNLDVKVSDVSRRRPNFADVSGRALHQGGDRSAGR